MSVGRVQLQMFLGQSSLSTAPASVMTALTAVEVQCAAEAPSTFKLTFNAGRIGSASDYSLLSGSLQPMNRLGLIALVYASSSSGSVSPCALIDGYITRQELAPGRYPRGTLLVVSGEDVSVKMNLLQISVEYPGATDDSIVNQILDRYGSLLSASVSTPSTQIVPDLWVPQQNDTDLAFVRELAVRNGFIFTVTPQVSGSSLGKSQAYWGPPVRSGPAQPPLGVDVGAGTNVDSIRFRFDSLAPTLAYGQVLQTESSDSSQNGPVSVVDNSSTRTPALATTPALVSPTGLTSNPSTLDPTSVQTRGTLLQAPGLTPQQATAAGQGMLDLSTDRVVVAEGQLDPSRYGGVLNPAGTVSVRGTGTTYDGLYYVQSVAHHMSLSLGSWSYKQQFVLTREGVGSTESSVAS